MKFKSFIILFAIIAIIFSGCNQTTTPVNTMPVPNAPSMLMATSIDNATVKIKWTPSTSKGDSTFKDYIVDIGPMVGFTSIPVAKTDSTCTIGGLTEGTVYTFTVHSRNTDNVESTAGVTVQWSPATRFTETANAVAIRVYEYASPSGSGLQFYDATSGGPQVVTVADGVKWNLALDTRNNSFVIGSPSQINYNYTGTPPITQIQTDYPWDTNTLDNIFDSQALDVSHNFTESTIDLSTYTVTLGLAFIARTHEGTNTTWNYAKILILKGQSGILQGSSPNRYIECIISYQKVADRPYAM